MKTLHPLQVRINSAETVPGSMAADEQYSRCRALVAPLGVDAVTIVGSHTSKSIVLPVMQFVIGDLTVTVRDNFHDVNFLVRCEKDLDIPFHFLYDSHGYQWYRDIIVKKRGYCYRGWSDAEMDDPRILRVKIRRSEREDDWYWSEVSGAAKDRWTKRDFDTAWYERDWSAGRLLTTGPVPFTQDTVFYVVPKAFAEGIKSTAEPYCGPCREFLNASDWDGLTRILHGLVLGTVAKRL